MNATLPNTLRIHRFATNWVGLLLATLCLFPMLTTDVHAATRVEVMETFPAGNEVALRGGENFYLRLRYDTDTPTHIWARPYFRGKPADAGTNTSSSFTGSGEALGWFFLNTPGDAVDEVRIMVGDGSIKGTTPAVSYPVRVVAESGTSARSPQPEWVTNLLAAAEEQRRAQQSQTSSGSSGVVLGGFMLIVLGLLIASVWLPVRALRRWHGGWRMAAVVPLALMGFVVLRIAVGVSMDATSHNLWPFEILQVGLLSIAIIVVLTVMRKRAGGDGA